MDNEKMWRFPSNNYATENDLDTSDMETFKKDPLASLARESCQNSIDARAGEHSVLIEFNSFELNKEDIPQLERLHKEVVSCKAYKSKSPKTVEALSKMEKEVSKDIINCLRISDFYTTGLLGVSKNEDKFYILTKGSGITDKTTGTTGGSKGIGKYASFVTSAFNTVFYSTKTIYDEEGYIGISKLCSTTIPDSDDKTQGIGYYGKDYKNSPILEELILDKEFKRVTSGTDIFILGFKKEATWKEEIITKILDSFMAAIYFEDLEVKIDGISINKETLKTIVDSDEYILKPYRNSIKSQYILLEDLNVYKTEIEIENYGTAKLYLKGFKKEEAHLATNECVMIRYPFMKIKSFKNISSVPCSAMCIIGNNTLNKILHNIENPQHTDWEPKRIDEPEKRTEVNGIIRELRTKINEFVYEKLTSSENKETDVEGASDFLPEDNSDNGLSEGAEVINTEKPVIVTKIKNKVKEKRGLIEDVDGNALNPSIGTHEEGQGSPVPEGKNSGNSGGIHDSDNQEGKNDEGVEEILSLEQLVGMQYRFFMTDKDNGKSVISFVSFYDKKNCELELYYLDDSGTKYAIAITNCLVNGTETDISDGKAVNFELLNGKKYKFELTTNLKDLYACEVKIYANR